jgi:hypothetical protein
MDLDPNTELPSSSTGPVPTTVARTLWRIAKVGSAITAGVATLGWLVIRPDTLLIEHVRFEGIARAKPEALRHLADVTNGATMVGVDLAAVRAGVERHPWVKGASVRREWPDTVVVKVDEYQPVALLRTERLAYLDASGDAFLSAQPDNLNYPVISGLTPDLAQAHPDLPALVVREALSLLDDLDSRGLVARDDVSELAFSRSRGFVVHTTGGAEMMFALERREQQLDRLAVLIKRGVRTDLPMLIDLAPERIAIVRPLNAGPS